jgi:uncharacterized membrane protein
MKRIIIITTILGLLGAWPLQIQAQDEESYDPGLAGEMQGPVNTSYETARINEVEEKERTATENDFLMFPELETDTITEQYLTVEVLSGAHRGETTTLVNSVTSNPLDFELKKGNKIVVYLEEFGDNTWQISVQDYYRLSSLIWFVVIFLLLLIVLGGGQGLRTVLSLVITIVLIFKLFIPQALNGGSPLGLAILISVLATIISLILISGWRRKTAAAISGTVGGVLIAGVLALIFGGFARLTGLGSEDSRILFSNLTDLNVKGLLLAGIIIGALGAVMDVSVSIASSIAELKKNHPEITLGRLIKSGLAIGRDIMGTMSNTLILAYVGASLPLLLLFASYQESFLKIMNFEFIAEEIVRAMAGSLGLIAAIPLTVLIASYLEDKSRKKLNPKGGDKNARL